MFVRAKTIKGKRYAYLVQNTWTGQGTRQKVGKYLGRILRPQKAKNEALKGFLNREIGPYVEENSFEQIVKDLVMLEFFNHKLKGFTVDTKKQKVRDDSGKDVVLELNEGFLCGETLKKLLEYEKGNDSGIKLAEILVSAGLNAEEGLFIELYGKFRLKEEEKKVEQTQDFYY